MSRIFVSHASENKASHVRPLVEALLHQGLSVWVDRPGMGEHNLGLSRDTIERHDVRGLQSGRPWDEQIIEAHRQCGAVLVCLSQAMSKERQVLVDELMLARYANKLVACIVDDLAFDKIPQDLGLAMPAHLQAPRLDTARLGEALRLLREPANTGTDPLTPMLREQWEVFLQLVADLRAVLRRQGSLLASPEELAEAISALMAFPHAPMVRYVEVPQALVDLLASRLDTPATARAHFTAAMQLALNSRDAGDTEQQVAVSPAEVVAPEQVPLQDYWTQVVAVAGTKSRRTLAALFLVPHALGLDQLSPAAAAQVAPFLAWLREPAGHIHPLLRST
jgi:hypothetical protein